VDRGGIRSVSAKSSASYLRGGGVGEYVGDRELSYGMSGRDKLGAAKLESRGVFVMKNWPSCHSLGLTVFAGTERVARLGAREPSREFRLGTSQGGPVRLQLFHLYNCITRFILYMFMFMCKP
jgi:hypothetical protein